jgi:hypothetical protein
MHAEVKREANCLSQDSVGSRLAHQRRKVDVVTAVVRLVRFASDVSLEGSDVSDWTTNWDSRNVDGCYVLRALVLQQAGERKAPPVQCHKVAQRDKGQR